MPKATSRFVIAPSWPADAADEARAILDELAARGAPVRPSTKPVYKQKFNITYTKVASENGNSHSSSALTSRCFGSLK